MNEPMESDFSAHQGSPGGVALDFVDERTKDPQRMVVSAALASAVMRATFVNIDRDAFAVSFSSLLIGLAATPDAVGEWLRGQFAASRDSLAALLRRRGWELKDFESLRAQAIPPPSTPLSRTASARQALQDAQRRADAASRLTETVDVLAALLMLPGFHDSDFQEMGIKRDAWAAAFAAAKLEASAARSDAPTSATAGQEAVALDLGSAGLEDHVANALRAAHAFAGKSLIGPTHVISAIQAASSGVSPAFTRFVRLVPPATSSSLPPLAAMPEAAMLDPNLRRHLLWAQRPAPGTSQPSQIWGRELITAVLLCPDELLHPVVSGSGNDLDLLRDLWFGYVTSDTSHRSRADWTAWWREAGVMLPQPRRAGYAVESDEGEDKLGVDVEAQAFARLILDKEVQPPLSIGFLGDWGSGKSFFIERIKKSINDLVAEGRAELHSEVVQIEFNAWHASDSNLWASLVTNIFDEIWRKVSPDGDDRDVDAARSKLEEQIKQARGAVHEAEAQVEIGRHALAKAEEDLEKKREILAWNSYVQSITVKQLDRLAAAAGWHAPIRTINDVDNTVRELAASGSRLRTLVTALLEKPVLHIALPTMAVLGGAAAAFVLVEISVLDAWQERLTQALSVVTGAIGTVTVPLRLARRKVDQLAKMLTGIQVGFDKALEEVKKIDMPRAKEVAQARRELESAEESVNVARSRLAELMNRQVALDPANRLSTFLQERVQSTQYRSQQGIISLVHKDFSELSRYMKDLRESAAKNVLPASGAAAIKPIDRIVLYVDDLDRCRPSHVVNMLEAVHLLLALDLFVVIVAVDSRWLTRALEVYYHDLLASDGENERDGMRESTPQNYLEKIFQITYALAPMQSRRFDDYVRYLTGSAAEEALPIGASVADKPSDSLPPASTPVSTSSTATVPTRAGDTSAKEAPTAGAANDGVASSAQTGRASSRPVRIGKHEQDLIVRLAPLLPTPRIAKRLVNVYRVIKAGKSVDDLEAFERQDRADSCLLMLAVLFGRPQVAGELLRGLYERTPPFDQPDERLVDALRRRESRPGETPLVTQAWQRTTETLVHMGVRDTVAQCARETQEVARYSLISGRDWHTWRLPTR